jgi:hypothetical protein
MLLRKHPQTQIDRKLRRRSGAADPIVKERLALLMLKWASIAFGIIIVVAGLYALRAAGY